jgi:hypothetical protein
MSGFGEDGKETSRGMEGAEDDVVGFMMRLLVYTSLRIVRKEENKLERTAVIMSVVMFVSFSLEWRYDMRGLYIYI